MAPGQHNILLLLQEVYNAITLYPLPSFLPATCPGRELQPRIRRFRYLGCVLLAVALPPPNKFEWWPHLPDKRRHLGLGLGDYHDHGGGGSLSDALGQ